MRSSRFAAFAALLACCAAPILAQVVNEVEPNDTKAQANATPPMAPGGTLNGISTSTSGVGLDYFLFQTVPMPLGIYRHRLIINSQIVGHTGTIRGLNQTSGVIGTTDTTVQTSSTTTVPPRFNQWYGFGRGEQIYYRINGTSTTTAPYSVVLESVAVNPVLIGPFAAGSMTIARAPGNTTDTDFWVYDSGLNPISTYGNDDPGTLTRAYSPGRYYLAITNFNFANNLPSPADDTFRSGAVMDFPGSAANSSTSTGLALDFTVTDGSGATFTIPASKPGPFDILWFCFDVGGGVPTGACCSPLGGCTVTSRSACDSSGGIYQGDGTTCAGAACHGPDNCADAVPVSDGTYSFTTVGATTDGPSPCGSLGRDIWWCYTAPCTGTATIATCGSGYDTVLAAYAGCVCPPGPVIVCNDDFCSLQSTITLSTIAGQQYLIQLGGFNGASGTGTMTISCVGNCQPTCDLNHDGVVNQADADAFAACLSGSGPCTCEMDYNQDGSVDNNDVNAACAQCGPIFPGCGGGVGACCLSETNCVIMPASQCSANGGLYQGDGSACTSSSCQPCADCGPGPHWIHNPPCPPGTDAVPSGAVIGIDTNLDCVRDQNLVMFGPVYIHRNGPTDDSARYPGTRPVDGHLDVIDTEMVQMTLTGGGATLVAGFGQGQGGVLGHTYGAIAEQAGDPTLADSFFDVFFEVTLGAQHLYNQTPLRADSVITCVPPNDNYMHPTGICIPLYTSPVPGQGVHVANLVSANHDTFPRPGACCFNGDCVQLRMEDCVSQGGTFYGEGVPCSPTICVRHGACCLPNNVCQDLTPAACAAQGGAYQGDGSVCGPATCQPCSNCGPGPHWIDNCPGGDDNIVTSALVGIDTNLDCVRDQNVILTGPVLIHRSASQDDSTFYPGTRPVDGHRDVIDTEIVSMSLTGSGVTLRAGVGSGTPLLNPSRGNIAEQAGNPALADSFFDVFFEVTMGTQHLYNQTPLDVTAIIDCVPPRATYNHPTGICIPLYTSPTPGQGVHVANLVSASHTTFPQTGACCLPGGGCQVLPQVDCAAQGGAFQGAGVLCTPTTCVPCSHCGPGPHWIDQCPGGDDNVLTSAVVGVDTNLDCNVDQAVALSGPAHIRRSGPRDDSTNYPGTRPVDGHLDVIDMELVSMNLSGGGITLRAGAGGSPALLASLGVTAEQPGNPALGDSFFDVFIEVTLGNGNQVYNQTPLRVLAVVDCAPPNVTYVLPDDLCVSLYTSPVPGQGVHVANLISIRHDTFPATGACCLSETNCQILTESDCRAQGGLYQGDNSACTATTCRPCSDCGPGPHWIHNPPCPPGVDAVPSGAVIGIDTNLDCVRDQNLVMFGPAYIRRGAAVDDSAQFPGTRPVDGHLDVIDTEMIELSLSGGGATLIAGFGHGAGGVLGHSYGNIAEQAGNPTLADSFFDVFFEVTIGTQHYYNQTPLRASSIIDCVPPNANYMHPTNICIPLYTSPIPGQGVHVANLVSANHDTFPRPGACCINGNCTQLRQPECVGQGGTFHGEGVPCTPTLCVQHGACCLPTGVCQDLTPAQCAAQGGAYQGDNSVCSPTTCQPCSDCGPGPHWIDNCPGGDDSMVTSALVGIDTNLDCVRDQNVVLTGPVVIRRSPSRDDSLNYPGTRPVDGHRDVIDTEILSMNLSGGGVTLRAGGGGAPPLAATLGTIAEQPGNPALADSFFDVFFEVTMGSQRLYNQTALRIDAIIDCVPPRATYNHPQNICIPLYTSPVPGQGVHVANLVSANHSTFPQRGACCINGDCSIRTANECEAAGGLYQGDNTVCSSNRCGPCAACGPGPHWVDTCSAGQDAIPTGALVGIDTNLDCVRDRNLVLQGPAIVQRANPSDDSATYPGTRPVDGHLDVIDTEMTSLVLTGGGATLRAGTAQGLRPSRGNIAELAGNPTLADSFFDVFFEIDLGAGPHVFNQTPLHVTALIDCVPPRGVYHHPQNICIPLYTSPIPGQGVHVANLVSANHAPFPDPCFGAIRGDSNCDGTVDNSDIDCFVGALLGHPCGGNCPYGFVCLNDTNGDGTVDNSDIDSFVNCLLSAPPPGESCPLPGP